MPIEYGLLIAKQKPWNPKVFRCYFILCGTKLLAKIAFQNSSNSGISICCAESDNATAGSG